MQWIDQIVATAHPGKRAEVQGPAYSRPDIALLAAQGQYSGSVQGMDKPSFNHHFLPLYTTEVQQPSCPWQSCIIKRAHMVPLGAKDSSWLPELHMPVLPPALSFIDMPVLIFTLSSSRLLPKEPFLQGTCNSNREQAEAHSYCPEYWQGGRHTWSNSSGPPSRRVGGRRDGNTSHDPTANQLAASPARLQGGADSDDEQNA